MARFDRVYSLVIGSGGQQGVEITELRIVFDVSKDNSKNPNRSKISVYNLAPETRKALEKPDVRCVFKAGYAEEDGPIEVYQGDVALVFSKFDGPNVITEIELGEGFKAIRDIMISLSYNSGVTSTKVLNDIAGKLKMPLNMPSDAPVRNWQNGLAFHGPARSGLDKITSATGLSWSVQGGALQVIRAGGNTNRTVVDLAADSGLVGHPERVRKGKQEIAFVDDDPKKQAQEIKRRSREIVSTTHEEDGWRVRSLLLPSLLPNDRVKLSSRSVEGVFTIKDLRHFGDTHGGDWITELKLLDPKPAESDERNQRPSTPSRVRQSNRGSSLPLPPPDPGPAPIPSGTVRVTFP